MVKAVVVRGVNETPTVEDVELRPLGAPDVRIRVVGAGVCHSDLSMVNGTLTPPYPLVLGHEASGVIAEVGSAVTGLEVGQGVVLNWAVPCRECWYCEHGQPWLCSTIEGITGTPGGTLADGTEVNVLLGIGSMAEEIVVPATAVVPVPDGVPLEEAALMGCAILTGVGAATNTARVQPGQSVLVIGQGGIGLAAVMGARLAGATTIIAVDRSAEKEELARTAGATHFLVADPKLSRQVRTLTDGRGADVALECVGAAATIRQAWGSVRRGGKCVIVGVGPRDQEVTFNPLELFHFSRTLTSSVYGDSDPERDLPKLGEHVRSGQLNLGALVTHRIGLDGVAEAFERMKRGEGGRSLVVFGRS
jgi:S-(hydroxymethyl)glutathione dehydrogenase/alcohol dehydrogenase